ncbi:Unknown protein [Striga hermonthica]|uniref:Uncharacterized protein n=1 Tax=Striga hermonthica TaxID=68872 RepID=A0A9N7R1Q4_STRHE|nr:Unknown protein [Striga hermonthica]
MQPPHPRFHIFLTRKVGRGMVPFFEGTPGNRSSGDGVGLVAQRIRARGYKPRCPVAFTELPSCIIKPPPMADRRLLAISTSCRRVAACNLN